MDDVHGLLSAMQRAVYEAYRDLGKPMRDGRLTKNAGFLRIAKRAGCSWATAKRCTYELVKKHFLVPWDVDGSRPRERQDGESILCRRKWEGGRRATVYYLPAYDHILQLVADDPDVATWEDPETGAKRFATLGYGRRLMSRDEIARWGLDRYLAWRKTQAQQATSAPAQADGTVPARPRHRQTPDAAAQGGKSPPRDRGRPPKLVHDALHRFTQPDFTGIWKVIDACRAVNEHITDREIAELVVFHGQSVPRRSIKNVNWFVQTLPAKLQAEAGRLPRTDVPGVSQQFRELEHMSQEERVRFAIDYYVNRLASAEMGRYWRELEELLLPAEREAVKQAVADRAMGAAG